MREQVECALWISGRYGKRKSHQSPLSGLVVPLAKKYNEICRSKRSSAEALFVNKTNSKLSEDKHFLKKEMWTNPQETNPHKLNGLHYVPSASAGWLAAHCWSCCRWRCMRGCWDALLPAPWSPGSSSCLLLHANNEDIALYVTPPQWGL